MNNVPTTYQSCKIFRYTGGFTNQIIKNKLKNKNKITKGRIDKNNNGEKISTVIATLKNVKTEKNGIVFDFMEHKQIKAPDYHLREFEEIDVPHKIYISGQDGVMIIFGSITGNSVPNIIFNILHPEIEDEYYFEDVFFDPKITDKVIHIIIKNNNVKLSDPRFVFGEKKFQSELRYAKFSLGRDTCFTDSKLYKKGLEICTSIEPIFEITKCLGLADEELTYSKILYFTNHGKFWFRGVSLDYLKWLDFLLTYCISFAIKNTNNN